MRRSLALVVLGLALGLCLSTSAQQFNRWVFHPWREANGAATGMIPDGWTAQGGVTYVNSVEAGAQALLPKFNLVIAAPDGVTQIEWFEETNFWSWGPQGDVVGQMTGAPMTNYRGYVIMPQMNAATFVTQALIPARRADLQMQVVEMRPLPELVQLLAGRQQRDIGTFAQMGHSPFADAALVSAQGPWTDERYMVGLRGTQFPMDGGTISGCRMWSNCVTVAWRCPRGQMSQWEPLLQMVRDSVQIDPQWLVHEHQRQGILAQQMTNLQQHEQQVLNDILESRRATTAAIAHSGYLIISGQHEQQNPVTGQTMLVPDEAANVWVDGDGSMVYSADAGYNPLNDQTLTGSSWQQVPTH